MLTLDQIETFKAKLQTRMLEVAIKQAKAELNDDTVCAEEHKCLYRFLSLYNSAFASPLFNYTPEQTESIVNWVTAIGDLNDVVPVSFTGYTVINICEHADGGGGNGGSGNIVLWEPEKQIPANTFVVTDGQLLYTTRDIVTGSTPPMIPYDEDDDLGYKELLSGTQTYVPLNKVHEYVRDRKFIPSVQYYTVFFNVPNIGHVLVYFHACMPHGIDEWGMAKTLFSGGKESSSNRCRVYIYEDTPNHYVLKYELFGGITIMQTTYDNLFALITANNGTGSLLIGGYYSIEYQNKHKVTDMPTENVLIWEHPVTEHLVLRAVSPNKLATECFSLEYPTDIIHYDINKNVCEDNVTPRDGFITYRKDTLLNNESEGFCFRSTVFPRYISVVPEWDESKEYNYSSVVKVAANNAIYIYRHITHFTGKPVTNEAYWAKVCNINDDLLWPYTGPGLDDFNRNLYQYALMHPGGGKGNPGDSGWPYTVYKVDINTTPKLFLCFTANRADSTDPNFGYHNWQGTGCVIKNAARGVDANNVIIATGMGTSKSNTGVNFKNIVLDNCVTTTIWTLQEINLYVGKDSSNNYFYNDNHSDNYIGSNCHNNFCGSYFVRNNLAGNNINNNIFIRLFADNFIAGYFDDSIFGGYTQGNVFGIMAGKLSWGASNFTNTIYGERLSTGHRMHSVLNFSSNTVAAGLPDVYVGSNCRGNKFMGKMTNCVLGDNTQNNVFNGLISNSGTFDIPLRFDSNVINQKFNNVQFLDTSITVARCIFNAVLDPYTFTISVADTVFPIDKHLIKLRGEAGSYTVTADDNRSLIVINSSVSCAVTLPVGLMGVEVLVKQEGAGDITFLGAQDVTVEQFEDKFTTNGPKSLVSCVAQSDTVWIINGQLKV